MKQVGAMTIHAEIRCPTCGRVLGRIWRERDRVEVTFHRPPPPSRDADFWMARESRTVACTGTPRPDTPMLTSEPEEVWCHEHGRWLVTHGEILDALDRSRSTQRTTKLLPASRPTPSASMPSDNTGPCR